jgi:hypothetical protein
MNVSRRSFLERIAAAFAGVAAVVRAKPAAAAPPIPKRSGPIMGLCSKLSQETKLNGQYNWWECDPVQFIRGNGAPSADIGKNGDTYLDTLTGKLYRRFEEWTHIATGLNS